MITPFMQKAVGKAESLVPSMQELPLVVRASSILPDLPRVEAKAYEYLSPSAIFRNAENVATPAVTPENVGQKIDFFAF